MSGNTVENTIELQKKLTVDWQSTPLVQTANPDFGFFKKVEQQCCPLKKSWRLPWDMVDYTELYNMQYHITINPDPECTWFTHGNDLKTQNKRYRDFLIECKKEKLYKNILSVYEYGKRGKEYGKVHWHILLQSSKVNKFVEMALKYFGTTKKSRWANTVVKKVITIDKSLSINATDEEKVQNYKNQIDYIMKKYMKKESQNQNKCLYTNMINKIELSIH